MSERAWRLPRMARDDERGQVGHMEVLPFGLLIFVVGALFVTNAWAVIDARLAVSAAAREATSAFVEATDAGAAEGEARAAAAATIAGHGRDPGRLQLDIAVDGGFGRCAPVTIMTRYEVPALQLPWVGGFGHAITARGTHTELVDPYRSGVAGATRC